MRRSIRVTEPSAEMQIKIQRARHAISTQKKRMVQCPYCNHNSIAVFEDTRGHVQAKCKQCGQETVFNVLSTSGEWSSYEADSGTAWSQRLLNNGKHLRTSGLQLEADFG